MVCYFAADKFFTNSNHMNQKVHIMKAWSPGGSIRKWFAATSLLLFSAIAMQAQTLVPITGTVLDASGEPIIGASVKVQGGKAVVTDLDGNYKMDAPQGATVEVSYVGCVPAKFKVTDAKAYNLTLQNSLNNLEEVVVVGYGTQKKATLTGAISSIGGDDLVTTKAQDTKNMLNGKIPGVRVTQNTSEPGDFSYGNFDIRGYGGSPLIVVDGVPRENFERLDPNEIESISVLKDASAAIYGARGGNGVILVTTKKGDEGRAKVTYSMYYGIQRPAEMLKPVGAIDRMTIYNEKTMRSLTDPRLQYTQADFDAYYNGEKTSLDWYDQVVTNHAPQQQHNVNVSGGTNKIDYFVNFSYLDQKGFLKSNDLDYNRYNVRSNITANLFEGLTFSAKLAGTLDKRERPYTETWEIFKTLWRSVPDEQVYANDNPNYYAHMRSDIQNPAALAQKDLTGYKKNTNKIFTSTFDATYALPWVQGLKVKGLFSYDNTTQDNSKWQQTYYEYDYDETTDTYTGVARNAPNQLTRTYNNTWSTLWQASVSYDNKFGNNNVSALMLYEESYTKYDDLEGSRYFTLQIPYMFAGNTTNQSITGGNLSELSRKGLVGRFTYNWDDKYFAEFAFRYDGSSKFAEGHQWGFFPTVQAGWRISEENFIKNNTHIIDNLKFRVSYGKMGDDSCADYQYLSGYTYPNTSGVIRNGYPKGGIFDGEVVNALGFRGAANPNITWYTIKTFNIGFDLDMWHGLLGATVEYYQRDRDGLLATRATTVPGNFGSEMPQENLNSDRTRGFELELRHNNRIGNVNYYVTGNIAYTRNQLRYVEQTPAGNSYENWTTTTNSNRYNDIWFGYGGDGRFTNWQEIAYANAYGMNNGTNSTLPGDYIYEDWNGDGVIDSMDKHPIATTISKGDNFYQKYNYPLLTFGLTLGGSWNGLDCSFTFQGAGKSYIAYGEQLSAPLAWNGNALEMFLDRWHPVDANAYPWDPSLEWVSGYYSYGGTTPDSSSEFAIQKGDYLRLKTAEIGYTLPLKWTRVVGIQNLRLFVNGYNLFTITNVKGVDPEKPAALYGYMYPLNRSYNFGLSVTF